MHEGLANTSGASRWVALDHVQLAIPVGAEDRARAFYVGLLGFTEIPKPAAMAARGGAWFEAGGVRLHVGAEPGYTPSAKAHPAIIVRDLPGLLHETGLQPAWNTELPGLLRCHVRDPFGNRLELIDADGT